MENLKTDKTVYEKLGLEKPSERKIDDNKTFFSVDEGSNYKVLMTYDRSEVIEFGQFKKLIQKINDRDTIFVTINQRVVKASTIIDISPTDELTEQQKKKNKENPGYKNLYIEDDNGEMILYVEYIERYKR